MTALPVIPGPTAAECCAPSAGENPTLRAERLASLAKALSEPLRVRIVDLLRRSEEPVCQCELIALFEIRQSLLSHHMKRARRRRPGVGRAAAQVGLLLHLPRGTKELTAWLS